LDEFLSNKINNLELTCSNFKIENQSFVKEVPINTEILKGKFLFLLSVIYKNTINIFFFITPIDFLNFFFFFFIKFMIFKFLIINS